MAEESHFPGHKFLERLISKDPSLANVVVPEFIRRPSSTKYLVNAKFSVLYSISIMSANEIFITINHYPMAKPMLILLTLTNPMNKHTAEECIQLMDLMCEDQRAYYPILVTSLLTCKKKSIPIPNCDRIISYITDNYNISIMADIAIKCEDMILLDILIQKIINEEDYDYVKQMTVVHKVIKILFKWKLYDQSKKLVAYFYKIAGNLRSSIIDIYTRHAFPGAWELLSGTKIQPVDNDGKPNYFGYSMIYNLTLDEIKTITHHIYCEVNGIPTELIDMNDILIQNFLVQNLDAVLSDRTRKVYCPAVTDRIDYNLAILIAPSLIKNLRYWNLLTLINNFTINHYIAFLNSENIKIMCATLNNLDMLSFFSSIYFSLKEKSLNDLGLFDSHLIKNGLSKILLNIYLGIENDYLTKRIKKNKDTLDTAITRSLLELRLNSSPPSEIYDGDDMIIFTVYCGNKTYHCFKTEKYLPDMPYIYYKGCWIYHSCNFDGERLPTITNYNYTRNYLQVDVNALKMDEKIEFYHNLFIILESSKKSKR
jgi:hypothetical protein